MLYDNSYVVKAFKRKDKHIYLFTFIAVIVFIKFFNYLFAESSREDIFATVFLFIFSLIFIIFYIYKCCVKISCVRALKHGNYRIVPVKVIEKVINNHRVNRRNGDPTYFLLFDDGPDSCAMVSKEMYNSISVGADVQIVYIKNKKDADLVFPTESGLNT